MNMFVVTDDNVRLNVRISGPKHNTNTVLLLHSLGCDLSMWNSQADALSDNFRIIRFDMRGHGASGNTLGEYTMATLAGDALQVLDAACVQRAHICGISLGGMIAQWLGMHARDKVNKLILANTAAKIGVAETWQDRRTQVIEHGLQTIADIVIQRFFSEKFRFSSPDMVETYRRILLQTNPLGYAGCCAALRDTDLRSYLWKISAPTLVIGGTLDVSTPLADVRTTMEGIAHAGLIALESAHLSNVEQPKTFTQAVRRHLETV